MRRSYLFFLSFCLLLITTPSSRADTYTLKDGTQLEARVSRFDTTKVQFVTKDGYPWKNYEDLSQDSLKQLYKEAPRPEDKANIEPYITELAQEKVKQREIEVKPVTRLSRPTGHIGLFAAFGSPIGLILILAIYGANIYAAYEISVFKNMPPGPVCGVCAVAPIIGPAVFLWLNKAPPAFSTKPATTTTETTTIVEIAEAVNPGSVIAEAAAPDALISAPESTAARLPDPIAYKRGEFSFNRRFFETKMPGFFRVVPGEKEKDLTIQIKSARGDFSGRRISRIGANDLALEIFKGGATADETIPFIDIYEVQIRHKDLPPA